MKAAALLLAGLLLAAEAARALEISGEPVQGGLIQGRAEPGAEVALNGKSVPVADDGTFLIGFGRDAEETQKLAVTPPGGPTETRTLRVKPRDYDIERIDGLPERKVTPRSKEDLARIRDDIAQIKAVRAEASGATDFVSGFRWPVTGRLSGVYGSQRILNGKPRRPHNGVDIAAPKGTPVKAMAGGLVALVHQDMFYTGKTVMIDHGLGLTSVYIHMNSIAVTLGERVAKGQKIGTVGMTGRATGPHLHWGVTWFDTHLDPALLAGPQPRE